MGILQEAHVISYLKGVMACETRGLTRSFCNDLVEIESWYLVGSDDDTEQR